MFAHELQNIHKYSQLRRRTLSDLQSSILPQAPPPRRTCLLNPRPHWGRAFVKHQPSAAHGKGKGRPRALARMGQREAKDHSSQTKTLHGSKPNGGPQCPPQNSKRRRQDSAGKANIRACRSRSQHDDI